MTGKGQNAASANCYFKGKGNRPLLALTMVHIFSQWGSLMCEQGSGRAVNRAFYEAARGELGCQWRGLSRICHVATLALACLFWWQHETGVTAGLVYTGAMSSRRAGSPWETGLWLASEPRLWSIWEHWSTLVEQGSAGAAGYRMMFGARELCVCHIRYSSLHARKEKGITLKKSI